MLFHEVNRVDVYLFPLKFADYIFDCLSFGEVNRFIETQSLGLGIE